MTEVVHCKVKKVAGVAAVASLCSQRYLDRVLGLCCTGLITLVGSKARAMVRELGLVPEAFGSKGSRPSADVRQASLGGLPRLLVYVPNFVSTAKQTYALAMAHTGWSSCDRWRTAPLTRYRSLAGRAGPEALEARNA